MNTVLVVDDHASLREEIVRLVNDAADLTVVGEADSGEDAIHKARSLSPDLILMDIVLPEMNGVDATREILDETPEMKVLVVSNYANKGLVRKMFEIGALGFVRKDYVFEELVDAITRVMRSNRFLGTGIALNGKS